MNSPVSPFCHSCARSRNNIPTTARTPDAITTLRIFPRYSIAPLLVASLIPEATNAVRKCNEVGNNFCPAGILHRIVYSFFLGKFRLPHCLLMAKITQTEATTMSYPSDFRMPLRVCLTLFLGPSRNEARKQFETG